MRIILFLAVGLLCNPCFSQTVYRGAVNSVKQEQNKNPEKNVKSEEIVKTKFSDSERSEIMKQKIKDMQGLIGNSQDTIQARNLLFLKEVLDFKLQDETLASEVEKLKQNREFNQQLLKALNQLDNKKYRNTKNQQIISILNDSGNRIYNSLSN